MLLLPPLSGGVQRRIRAVRERFRVSGPGVGARAMALALVFSALCGGHVAAQQAAALSADQATAIATDAYIYGYPLVTVEMTRRIVTNVAAPVGLRAPMGPVCRRQGISDRGL